MDDTTDKKDRCKNTNSEEFIVNKDATISEQDMPVCSVDSVEKYIQTNDTNSHFVISESCSSNLSENVVRNNFLEEITVHSNEIINDIICSKLPDVNVELNKLDFCNDNQRELESEQSHRHLDMNNFSICANYNELSQRYDETLQNIENMDVQSTENSNKDLDINLHQNSNDKWSENGTFNKEKDSDLQIDNCSVKSNISLESNVVKHVLQNTANETYCDFEQGLSSKNKTDSSSIYECNIEAQVENINQANCNKNEEQLCAEKHHEETLKNDTKMETEDCAIEIKNNPPKIDVNSEEDSVYNKNTENEFYTLTNNYFCNKIIELSRLAFKSNLNKQNYFRGCKWSPDGTCILSIVNNGGMQITELPRDLYSNQYVSTERPVDILNPTLCIKEAGLVYDFEWYPKMNSYNPVTCCWMTSIQHGPVQLWDAFDGTLRSSYRGYNEVDEVEAALCTRFSPNGENIFAGYKKTIKMFDTDRPGRDYLSFRIKQPASCMALNSSGDLMAIGSWRRTITLMSINSGELNQFDTIYGHKGGVTHLMFMDDLSTNSTNYLLSGARMDPTLFMWDIRQTTKPVQTFCRQVISNQRIYFDLSPYYNTWLISASTSGLLRVWDLSRDKEFKFPVHNDCCNGASFHPSRPIIATSSGRHHFIENYKTNDEDCENDMQSLNNDNGNKMPENAMVFWWISKIESEDISVV